MGTNYYHITDNLCPHCHKVIGERLRRHIGKCSGGWCFALHVYPDDEIHDLPDWLELFQGGHIQDEYGHQISPGEMVKIITERSWKRSDEISFEGFCRANHATPGPNGLARHSVDTDSEFCIGHGEGTWDLLVGEFS